MNVCKCVKFWTFIFHLLILIPNSVYSKHKWIDLAIPMFWEEAVYQFHGLYINANNNVRTLSNLNLLLSVAEVSSGGLWLTATCWPWLDSTSIQATPAIIRGEILILSQTMFSFHWGDLQTQIHSCHNTKESGEGSDWGKWTVRADVKEPLSKVTLSSPEKTSSDIYELITHCQSGFL